MTAIIGKRGSDLLHALATGLEENNSYSWSDYATFEEINITLLRAATILKGFLRSRSETQLKILALGVTKELPIPAELLAELLEVCKSGDELLHALATGLEEGNPSSWSEDVTVAQLTSTLLRASIVVKGFLRSNYETQLEVLALGVTELLIERRTQQQEQARNEQESRT